MASRAAAPAVEDTGLDALVLLLRFHEIAVDPAQIRHQHGVRYAKQFRRILIFDEALDYESERVIQDNMRRIAAGRTVLIIAHRLSAVAPADRIITIECGRIVEDGNHAELIARGGHTPRCTGCRPEAGG